MTTRYIYPDASKTNVVRNGWYGTFNSGTSIQELALAPDFGASSPAGYVDEDVLTPVDIDYWFTPNNNATSGISHLTFEPFAINPESISLSMRVEPTSGLYIRDIYLYYASANNPTMSQARHYFASGYTTPYTFSSGSYNSVSLNLTKTNDSDCNDYLHLGIPKLEFNLGSTQGSGHKVSVFTLFGSGISTYQDSGNIPLYICGPLVASGECVNLVVAQESGGWLRQTQNYIRFVRDLSSSGWYTQANSYNNLFDSIDKLSGDSSKFIEYKTGSTHKAYFELEASNRIPDIISLVVNASGGVSTRVSCELNSIEIGSVPLIGTSGLKTISKTLSDAEKDKIFYKSRQDWRKPYLGINLSGVTAQTRIYSIEVFYSGGNVDNNQLTTGIYKERVYPNRLNFDTISDSWKSASGTNPEIASLIDQSNTTYLQHTTTTRKYTDYNYPTLAAGYWEFPSGLFDLHFESNLPSFTQISKADLVLRIQYSGIGVDKNFSPAIFGDNRFIQGHNSVSSKYGLPHIVGNGERIQPSSITDYVINLQFTDPFGSGNNHHTDRLRGVECFKNLDLRISNIPSGLKLYEAYLDLFYNSGTSWCPLNMIGGSVSAKTQEVPGSGFYTGGHVHAYPFDFESLFNHGYYELLEGSGNIYSITGSQSGVCQDANGNLQTPQWWNYMRNGNLPGVNYFQYRNAIYIDSGNNYLFNFGHILPGNPVVTDFTLMMQVTLSGVSAYELLNSTLLTYGTTNNWTLALGYDNSDFSLAINDVDTTKINVGVDPTVNDSYLYCLRYTRGVGFTTNTYYRPLRSLATTGGIFTAYTDDISNTSSHNLYFGGNCLQSPANSLFHTTTNYGTKGIPCWLQHIGIASSSLSNLDLQRYFDTQNDFYDFLDNTPSGSDNKYIQIKTPYGSGSTTFAGLGNSYNFYQHPTIVNSTFLNGNDYIDLDFDYYDTPAVAGYGSVDINPSAIRLELICDHHTEHPSGLVLYANTILRINTLSYPVLFKTIIPSGSKRTITIYPDKLSLPRNIPTTVDNTSWDAVQPSIDVQYESFGSGYTGDFKIYSVKTFFDGWSVPETGTSTLNLYTSGNYGGNTTLDLFLYNNTSYDDVDLYLYGHQYSSGSLDLSLLGGLQSSGSLDLYMSGYPSNTWIPLHTIAGYSQTTLDLYEAGHLYSSGDLNLYTLGHTKASGSFDLFIEGIYRETASLNLHTTAGESKLASGSLDLYVWGTSSSGLFAQVPLSLNVGVVPNENLLPLHTFGGGYYGIGSGNLNLIAFNDNLAYNSIDLFLQNTAQLASGNINLFCKAPSGTYGAVPVSGNMDLIMGREYDGVSTSLMMSLLGPVVESGILGMYVFGTDLKESGTLNFITNGYTNFSSVKHLYTHGF